MGENLKETETLSEREKFALSRIENSPLRVNSPIELKDAILITELGMFEREENASS